jgi:hypothetical protein
MKKIFLWKELCGRYCGQIGIQYRVSSSKLTEQGKFRGVFATHAEVIQ